MKLNILICILGLMTTHVFAKAALPKGWKLPLATEYTPEYCGKNSSPFLVQGDFDADGKKDIAALARKGGGLNLIVVFDFEHKSAVLVLEEITYGAGNMALRVTKGPATVHQTGAVEGNLEIRVKGDYFELIYCEKSSVAFCWNAKKKAFEQIWTSD